MEWEEAPDIKQSISHIRDVLSLHHIDSSRVFCYRTQGSKSRSYARIWAFPKIFQRALGVKPAYVVEVLSRYFDKLNEDEQKKVLIHELLHIPANFSGGLVPHRSRGRRLSIKANQLFKEYKKYMQ